jgi:hypothetical protein
MPQETGDKLIKNYDEFEDAVTEVIWSAGSPWTFASLSFNGQLILNSVPQDEKYKLLL